MALKFKNGDKVRQIQPAPIEGTVASFRFDASSGEINVLVQRIDDEGNIHENVFQEDQLEAISKDEDSLVEVDLE